MMTKTLMELDGWTEAKTSLATCLKLSWACTHAAAFSDDPSSPYRLGYKLAHRVIDQLKLIAMIELKEIDDAIADSDLVESLLGKAKQAKQEAENLKKTTATIGKITSVVDEVVSIVGKFVGLPFL